MGWFSLRCNYHVICDHVHITDISERLFISLLHYLRCWADPKWHAEKAFSAPGGVECAQIAALGTEFDVPVSVFHVKDGVYLLPVQVPLYVSRGRNVVLFPLYGFVQWLRVKTNADLAIFLLCDDEIAHPICWLICWSDDAFHLKIFERGFEFFMLGVWDFSCWLYYCWHIRI